MGYEWQAKVVPPIEPMMLQNALKEKFVSLRWEIVRPQENLFSVAVAGRADIGWDEDFVVGVGHTLEQAVSRASALEPSSAQKAQTFIYLLHHLGINIKIAEIMRVIDDVINQFNARAVWEELSI